MEWDNWQKQVIEYEGSVTIRAGRQVGKSTVVGKRCADLMLKHTESVSLIIAPAQRQSSQLFIKVQSWLQLEHEKALQRAGGFKPDPKASMKRNMENRRLFEHNNGIYNEQSTKTTIVLKKDFSKPPAPSNRGAVCYSLPAGKTGVYLRTYALDFLYIDEAAYVPEAVYTALKPMLAVSQQKKNLGWETFLSTPFGKGGFFYLSHNDPEYKQFHVNSEKCKRISPSFLRKEKLRMTKAEYRQEWQGEFTDEWNQFFPTKLIKDRMTFISWSKKEDAIPNARYYLGVDIARYGGDENAFVICELAKKSMKIVKVFATDRVSTTDTIGRIQVLDKEYNFSKIFVDDAGVGGSVTDVLIDKLGRKVLGLNNASKRVQIQGEERKKGILKEDLYSNTLMLMETKQIELINDMKLARSMKSITYEYGESNSSSRNVKIFGTYSHLTEGLVRACWCTKERGLNIYLY